MVEHTKEPWAVRELLPDGQIIRRKGTYEIYTVDYDVCATLTDGAPIRNKADADRIVACVNACVGINPEAIPGLLKAAEDIIHQIRISEPNCLFLHEQTKQLEAAIALAGKWGN